MDKLEKMKVLASIYNDCQTRKTKCKGCDFEWFCFYYQMHPYKWDAGNVITTEAIELLCKN